MAEEHTASERRLLASGSLGAGLVLVVVLVLIVNYFGWKYHQRFDWTASRFYSLSDKSLGVLEDLEESLEIIVFMAPGSELYQAVTELLSRYEAASPRIAVRVIDGARNPAEADAMVERYDVMSDRSIVLAMGGERRTVEESDLADYDYSNVQYGGPPQIVGFKGEQVFTGAILELVEQRKPRILFTTGHGEAVLDDTGPHGLSLAQDFLGRDNFEMEPWGSLGSTEVPEGTDLVIVAGPQIAFLEPEIEVLDRYLAAGGRLLLMLDPNLSEQGLEPTGFEAWLESRGVALGRDIVVDPVNPLPFYSPETFFVSDYDDHPITAALAEASYPVILSLSRSVGALDRAGEGPGGENSVTELMHSSFESWGETNLVDISAVGLDDADLGGPVSLGVALELPATDAEEPRGGRLAVFGDADFATNEQLPKVGNATLLLNTMNWLAERENLLAIPPKDARQVSLNLRRGELSSINWLVLLLLPGLAMVGGVSVYRRRRR